MAPPVVVPPPASAPQSAQSPPISQTPAAAGSSEGKYVVWSSSPANDVPRGGPEDI
jgi:hypothetical protein